MYVLMLCYVMLCMYVWMDGRTDGGMDGWMDGCLCVRAYVCIIHIINSICILSWSPEGYKMLSGAFDLPAANLMDHSKSHARGFRLSHGV